MAKKTKKATKAKKSLLKTRTFWTAVVAVAVVIIKGYFDGDWSYAPEKLIALMLTITGRGAMLKLEA